ncbi:MAG: C39 family peptidase [Treponema sp.]|nr:C39 family peptidase [Treponema sp.]
MIIHNISSGKDNYSQRNNEVRPLSSCNTTSMVMATSYSNELWGRFWESPFCNKYKQFSQPEDRLQQALIDWKLEPTSHYDLMKGYNKFMGGSIDSFSVSAPLKELIDELLSGRPWVASGTFPGWPEPEKKPLGHIVCVVGMHYETNPYKPAAMIIDDPYGNTMNNWKGSGNDIVIPFEKFAAWFKPVNNGEIFWAHCFMPF